MAEKFFRWDSVDDLTTEEDITLYFQACTEDDPGDGSAGSRSTGRHRQRTRHEPAGT